MKTVFITGAAHGIGLASARLFAARGYFVGLYDVNREGLEALLDSGEFPHVCAHYCDVTQRQSVDDALKHFAGNTNGRLDVLINNAGVLSSDRFEEVEPALHNAMIDVNIRGVTQVAQAAFPLLKQSANACLVNLCSVSSVHGIPLLAVYSASKFYVDGLTQALSLEWAQHDIRVTCVKPPLVNTPMGHSVQPQLADRLVMNMQAEDVARAIERAVAGSRDSYILGRSAIVWGTLDRLLPEAGRRALVRWLTGL
jgi:NAD(P)-dependent dehydrogenase (short-subunit alcohol dehydrogenase family)